MSEAIPNRFPRRPGASALSDRQAELYDFVYGTAKSEGRQPSLQEMADFLGIKSLNYVSQIIDSICTKGWLARDDGRSRGLRIVRRPDGSRFRGFAEKRRGRVQTK